jgi:hypothetical protein
VLETGHGAQIGLRNSKGLLEMLVAERCLMFAVLQNARNVLVRSSASGGVVAKLADLGISRVIKQHSTHRTTNTVGTMSHMVSAPHAATLQGSMRVPAPCFGSD